MSKRNTLNILVTLLTTTAALVPAPSANATDRFYVGPVGGDWNTAGNWSPFGVPGGADSAWLSADVVNLSAATAGLDTLVLEQGCLLSNQGFRLLVDDQFETAWTIVDDGSLLIISPTGQVNDMDTDNLLIEDDGVLLLFGGATVDFDTEAETLSGGAINGDGEIIANGTLFSGGALIASDGGLFTANGGTLTVTGGGAVDLDGNTGAGALIATEADARLVIDVPLHDLGYNGAMTVGAGNTFECTDAVETLIISETPSRGSIALEGGAIVAPDTRLLVRADLDVTGGLNTIDAKFELDPTAVVTIAPGSVLRSDGSLTFRGGSHVMGLGELETNGPVTVAGDTGVDVDTFDLDGDLTLSQHEPVTILPGYIFSISADAIDTSGVAPGAFGGIMRVDGGHLNMWIDGGAIDFNITNGGFPSHPARLELIDNGAQEPTVDGGSDLVINLGGTLHAINNVFTGDVPFAWVYAKTRFVSGTVEIDSGMLLVMTNVVIFDGGTTFTGYGVLDLENVGVGTQIRADQTIGTRVWMGRDNPVRLDDGVTLTFERGARLTSRVEGTSGPGSSTTVVLDGDSGTNLDFGSAETLISVDTFDWDGVERGDTFTVGYETTFVIDSARLDDEFNEYADEIVIEDGGAVFVNTDDSWRLRTHSGFPQATIRLAGPDATLDGQLLDNRFGNIIGNGQMLNAFINEGDVIPTSDVYDIQRTDTLTFGSSYLQRPNGRLHIDIESAADFDRVVIGGTATLDGELHVTLRGAYVPPIGATFEILQAGLCEGTFSTLDAVMPAHLKWNVIYGADRVTLEVAPAGDLDDDGVVNVSDLLALLGAWGPCAGVCPPACTGDLDGDCTVGTTDLLALLGGWG